MPICQITSDYFNPGTYMIDFGSAICVNAYQDKTFRIINIGDGILGGTISISWQDGGFSIIGDDTYALAPYQYKDFTLRFQPPDTALRGCTIDTGNALCVEVYGIGTGNDTPVCSVSPLSLDFGELYVGASLDKTFRITNTGCGTLSGTISLTSYSDPDFSIIGDDTYSLGPDEYKDFTIRFEPLSEASLQATVETGNALCGDVSCAGTGNDTPVCSLNATFLNFGRVETESYSDLTLRITNNGGGTLAGELVASGADQFSTSDTTYSLANGEFAEFTVRFEPDLPGIYTGSIDTGNEDCGSVSLAGSSDYEKTIPYLRYGDGESYEETVYLRRALVAPYETDHDLPATVTRSEDKKLKVYKHSLAGPRKRIFMVTAYLENRDVEGYRWLDLETFYWDTIEGPTKQITFRDNDGHIYLVRVIQFGPPQRQDTPDFLVKIRMVLEEDYADE